ncbi:MAG: type IV pilus secretin PilQ [Candidatus Aminicenantes bacterium]|nr:MAG: type IV pilus secretin PilQ [Candidatus Aminicenantes bacterium]
MKIKALSIVIFILGGMITLSLSLQANADNAVIKDIEYLTGDDFVQLYFKIDRMIPIPDVFYPEKDNNTRIVMRMNNVSFTSQKNLLKFDSSVIDFIRVIHNAANTDVDIEIRLKEQVNYRVFTNQKGLYIEFPKVKRLSGSTPSPPSLKSSPPTSTSAVSPASIPGDTDAGKDMKIDTNTDKRTNTGANANKNQNHEKKSRIKDIIISEKDPNRIKFRIIMQGSPAPDLNVIPITEEPVRLAIDFKNTRCNKRIKKTVNLLNVKQVRGGYNTPVVYRVVFDLEYLKKYKISPIMNGKVVEVEFFNEGNHDSPGSGVVVSKNSTAADPSIASTAPSAAPIDIEVKEEGLVLSNTPENPENINVDVKGGNNGDTNTNSEAGNDNGGPGETGNGNQSQVVLSNTNNDTNNINGVTITQGEGALPTITNVTNTKEDFFGDEKSRIMEEEVSGKQAVKEHPTKRTIKSGTDTSYITFESKTIDDGERKYRGEPMGFNFHNADLKDVISMIAKISGLNIVLDPGVSGKVTSQLTQVPWDQALDLFLKINGLDMVQEGNIIRIGRVEALAAEAQKRLALKSAQQLEGELTVYTRTLSFAKARDVTTILKRQLSKRGEILEDARSNTLIISEVPSRIEILDKLIDTLDTPNPQVSIEARIVETNANYIESFGIQWGYNFIADATHGNQTTLKFPHDIGVYGNQFTSQASPLEGPLGGYAVNFPASGAQAGTLFTMGNVLNTFRLDVALSAMQSKGEGKIISAPKTTTQNNMEASIMQGKQIPIQTIQNNTVTVQYRPAALELKVTPQITAEGTIICKLEINNNAADFANLVNFIPPIITQSIKTTVMVPDGGTIVIGGMYRVEKSTSKEGVPFFSKIPILGTLFRSKTNRSEQKELLVFITPRIIK